MYATSTCSTCSMKMSQSAKGSDWTMDDGSPLLSAAAPAGFSDSMAYMTAALAKDPAHYNSALFFHQEQGYYPWQHTHSPGFRKISIDA